MNNAPAPPRFTSYFKRVPTSQEGEIASPINPFTRDQYRATVNLRRREFIESHFHDSIQTVFDKLRQDAGVKKTCEMRADFIIPSHFDRDSISADLAEYFGEYGYDVHIDVPKDTIKTVSLRFS